MLRRVPQPVLGHLPSEVLGWVLTEVLGGASARVQTRVQPGVWEHLSKGVIGLFYRPCWAGCRGLWCVLFWAG